MDPFVSVKVQKAQIRTLKNIRNVYICFFWLFFFFLDLFGQGVEPFEVKGNTYEIPFAFHCVQSA
jgi:hypothetical protein